MDKIDTFCAQCGANVDVDDDGCCVLCGATAIGDGVGVVDRLRAQLSAKDEEIAEANRSRFFWKTRLKESTICGDKRKLNDLLDVEKRRAGAAEALVRELEEKLNEEVEIQHCIADEANAAEARVRNCHELIAEATCLISPEDHAELTEQFQNELSGCDCLTVFDEQADRIAALEAENRELSSGIVTAETLTLSHEGHIEKLEAEIARLRSNHEQ